MKRRDFVQLGAACLAAGSATTLIGREPIQRSGPARFQVGLAAYSLRDYFSYKKGKDQKPKEDGKAIDMVGFLDYCVANGFDAAELTAYFFPPNQPDQYFLNLKREAFERGVAISGTAIGNNFTVGKGDKLQSEIDQAIQWIDRAAALGAPHIRFFAGTAEQLAKDPARLQEAADAVNHCATHAGKKGVYLGIENHGRLSADQMIQIMDLMKSPWVGINLDTGNFISDDPYADLERCAAYAVNIQVKVTMKDPNGKHYPADMQRIGKILKDSGYQGYVILEYEDEDPYGSIPKAHEQLRKALA